jgi:uncharacterized membrane protein
VANPSRVEFLKKAEKNNKAKHARKMYSMVFLSVLRVELKIYIYKKKIYEKPDARSEIFSLELQEHPPQLHLHLDLVIV